MLYCSYCESDMYSACCVTNKFNININININIFLFSPDTFPRLTLTQLNSPIKSRNLGCFSQVTNTGSLKLAECSNLNQVRPDARHASGVQTNTCVVPSTHCTCLVPSTVCTCLVPSTTCTRSCRLYLHVSTVSRAFAELSSPFIMVCLSSAQLT